MVSDCLGYWMSFFTSPLDLENCQSSADSVFSYPCHGFCNQRKKSIFRCNGWMCLTLAQRRSIHHRNTLKGGQTLTPAPGPDINDLCGQPNGKHFIFIYSVLAYKNNFLPDNTWLSWSNSHSVEAEGLKKERFTFCSVCQVFSHSCSGYVCWLHSRWNHLEVFTHTPEDILLPRESFFFFFLPLSNLIMDSVLLIK